MVDSYIIETKNDMKCADLDTIINRIYHGDYFLIDTRPAYEFAVGRIVGSLNIPSPANVNDLTRVPSLVWVGLYCVNDEQQAIFNHAITNANILIAADNADNTWAKRLYELFGKSQTNNQTVRFVDITKLQSLAPIMFSPSTQPSWDRCKPASIIIPNILYLSSLSEAINPKICGNNGYLKPTHIINISNKENSNVFENIGVKYLTIRIDDSESSNISQYFEETFNFIDDCIRKTEGKLLCHCQMGISRASTICIYYLMRAKNMTLHDAYHYLKFRRPEIFPNRSFMIQLMEAEIKLRKGESSVKYSDIGKIGGLVSEYNNTTPAGENNSMMCETCFVM